MSLSGICRLSLSLEGNLNPTRAEDKLKIPEISRGIYDGV
jgi:hypothetical protein